ncbi:MAG: HAMP domain-containing sensor histidine kinase [Caulobacteraceae bacterium]
MRLPLWRWPLWRWTVSHQILILVAVSVLAAQVSGLIVALTLPQRPLATLAIEQASDRIKDAVQHLSTTQGADAAREARALSDRRLVFTVLDLPPAATTRQDAISARLAQALGMPADSVRVDFGPGGPRRGGRRGPGPNGFGPGTSGQSVAPGADLQPAPPGPDPQPGPPPETFSPPGPPPGPEPGPPSINQRLDRAIGQSRPPGVYLPRTGGRPFRLQGFPLFPRGRLMVKAGDHWLLVRGGPGLGEDWWLRQVVLTFALTLAALLLPALWIGYRMARRIGAFAEAADRFGRNPDAPQLPVEGPYELQQAAGAFNRMQARIQRLVSDRTMMMAAVSHDLRTPLARVRFRINDLEPSMRDAIAEDVRQMDELITQMLAFTRDALPNAERRRFDLSALAQSLVDDLADSGGEVTFRGPEKLTVEGNLAAVRRVLSNLLDNALKYAGHAGVELKVEGDVALAIVEDHGPGVPAGLEEAIFEPFRRLEPSRNRKTGGVGLGLAIARNLARGHGGDIVLEPCAPHGARFVFSLPLA